MGTTVVSGRSAVSWHARRMALRTMDVRGGAIVVDDPGPGGVPLLWAHGLTSSRAHEDITGLFGWRARGGMRVIRYDARGHGDSPGTTDPADYTWPVLAEDLLALMDGLGLARGAVGGASMGCATALYATVAAPDRIDRLVLVIPPTAWETRAAQREVYLAAAQLVEDRGPAAMAEQMRRQPPVGAFGADGERRRGRGPGALRRARRDAPGHDPARGRRRRTCRPSTSCGASVSRRSSWPGPATVATRRRPPNGWPRCSRPPSCTSPTTWPRSPAGPTSSATS